MTSALVKPCKKKQWLVPLLLLFLSFNVLAQNLPTSQYDLNEISAFPGAEGFGRFASGGRGGQILKVTNLNDDGPGSFREAVRTRGPRIVVFEVSGNIQLQSTLIINEPNITIAGQTAPGDGITITNYKVRINTENVIVRFLRFRLGDNFFVGDNDALEVRNSEHVIIDHCSLSWGTDETGSFYGNRNFTLQWSILSEGLNRSIHESGGAHGFGGLWGGFNASFHHNLLAHFTQRNPAFDHVGLFSSPQQLERWRGVVDMRNNIIYNWQFMPSSGGELATVNLVNNYYKPGPATNNLNWFLRPTNPSGGAYGKFFISGNILFGNNAVSIDNWNGVTLQNSQLTNDFLHTLKLSSPLPADVYENNNSASVSYQRVLANAGANLFRDPVDTRIVQETQNGTFTFRGSNGSRNGIIDSQKDVGGWPNLRSLPAPLDTDGDGIPDAWELANGLNPQVPNDKEYNLSPYYTDIEVYINSLVQNLVTAQSPGVPQRVQLTLPSNNQSVVPVEISLAWRPLSNAQSYTLQFSKASDFSSGVITVNNITNHSIVYPSLDPNSTYFWRVRARNASGNGPYSLTGTFRTITTNVVPARTVLLSPSLDSQGVGLTPMFSWAKVPNATNYRIQVSTTSDFSNIIINQSNLTTNQFQATVRLQENRVYFWRVRASNALGNGSNSLVGSFRTLSFNTNPSPVVAIAPFGGLNIDPINVRLQWIDNPTAERYQIQVSTDPTFQTWTLNNNSVEGGELNISNLSSNTVYYWRIRGINRSGTGSFSITHQFKTKAFSITPAQINLTNPVHDSNIFSSSILFSWEEDPIAQSYRFQLSTNPNFTSFVTNVGGLTNTSRTVSNLTTNRDYFWRVQAVNEAGAGEFSEVRKVRAATFSGTPPATNLISPLNEAVVGASTVLFSWENQPNTEFYRLEVSESFNFSTTVLVRTSIRGTSIAVDGLQTNRTYFWRIRTSNPAGTGERSDIWSFRTVSGEINLYPATLISPQKAASFQNSSINFNWDAVSEATAYHLQVSERSDFSTIAFQNQTISATSFTLSSLSSDKAYFWRVRARNGSIFSAWSDTWNFSIGSQDNLLNVGLVGYWPMEEGAGNRMLDQSGNNLHATIQDTRNVSWEEGKEGKSISLPGTSGRFGTVSHQSSLNIPNAITLAAWVKPSEVGNGTIFSKSASNGFELWFDSDGNIEFRLNRSSAGTRYRVKSNYNYRQSINKWIHVAATFDGSTSTIFINGIEDISVTYAPFQIGTTSGNLILGSLGEIQRWRGELDELRIYNRSLNRNEILLLMGELIDETPPSVEEKLVGYWKMDEGSGNQFLDHSGNNFHASILNSSGIQWQEGIQGQAVNLPGFSGRYGTVAHQSKLSLPNALTIAAWVNPAVLGKNTIISKAAGNGFELWLDSDGLIEFRLNRGNNGATYRLRSQFNYNQSVNKWFHIAATFDGKTSTIYINGKEDISQTFEPFGIGTNAGDLVIGALGTIQRFSGKLDEVRLYNTALTPAEIQTLANLSIDDKSSASVAVGHWKMDEGFGNQLLDDSGNGFHALIEDTGGIAWSTGVLGQAINLPGFGGRFGIVSHQSKLSLPNAITITAWVNPSVVGRSTIISKSDGNGFELWLDHNGFIEFRLNRGTSGGAYRLLSNFNYAQSTNRWFHVTATFDGNTSKIFINGIEDVTRTYDSFTIGTKSGDLVIGALGTIQRFTGKMDDLRLYDRALDISEIQDLTNLGSAFKRSGVKLADYYEGLTLGLSMFVEEERPSEVTGKPMLFPNPVNTEVSVSSLWKREGAVQVVIYDVKGAVLSEQSLNVSDYLITMDLQALHLRPGYYMLVVQDKMNREIFRFVKK
ncbi:LamG-like jellyroll fold domain-containing protein [Mongoliitalea daihaiensis]|uniref:LamG-like jellyroll fold domain-containing protein n=1 Tax=Mongoliitalea daihaiensis TaxID=2782006 RepID=UPI001F30FD11|nr:LamG-like jellyroll fold domain-containing protein [Mongoliitalea daihaiensis]UJP64905.1 T9SS type A sorting domain-containing protein [Mongoliitalea daihaiensis]